DWNGSENGLTFLKEAEGALIPMASPATETLAQSAAAAIPDGRVITAPAAPIAAEAKADQGENAATHRGLPSERAKHERK
ncbi:MAG: hypothetical protein ACRD5R_15755, partial [Candidatus Acidiferrales bacterium]